MHLFLLSFYATGVLYAIFNKPMLLLFFLFFVGGYVIISATYKGAKPLSNRKKINLGTWKQPQEGVITVRLSMRTQKLQKILNQCPKDQKITIAHFIIKVAGQILRVGKNDLNGKLVFGKFVPYKTCDISYLVNLNEGKDVKVALVKQVEKKSVKDIADFIIQKEKQFQKNKKDEQINKKNSTNFVPIFLLSFFLQIASFISNKLGISIPVLGVKKEVFGAATVISIGSFGFEDGISPFSGNSNTTFTVSVCKIYDTPVIQNGKVVPGRVMNLNFVADHRYIDAGKAKTFPQVVEDMFKNPQKFLYTYPKQQ